MSCDPNKNYQGWSSQNTGSERDVCGSSVWAQVSTPRHCYLIVLLMGWQGKKHWLARYLHKLQIINGWGCTTHSWGVSSPPWEDSRLSHRPDNREPQIVHRCSRNTGQVDLEQQLELPNAISSTWVQGTCCTINTWELHDEGGRNPGNGTREFHRAKNRKGLCQVEKQSLARPPRNLRKLTLYKSKLNSQKNTSEISYKVIKRKKRE